MNRPVIKTAGLVPGIVQPADQGIAGGFDFVVHLIGGGIDQFLGTLDDALHLLTDFGFALFFDHDVLQVGGKVVMAADAVAWPSLPGLCGSCRVPCSLTLF